LFTGVTDAPIRDRRSKRYAAQPTTTRRYNHVDAEFRVTASG
jgi:hypothetical protein